MTSGPPALGQPAVVVSVGRAGVTVDVDVAVVGGGPAGASAAYFLAREGRSVVVLEQKTFPRDKTCGDGLTPRSIHVLDAMGLGARTEAWQRVVGVRIRTPDTMRVATVPRTRRWCDYGVVVPRRVLDQVVLDNAEAAGATVRYGTKAHRPLEEHGVVRGVVATAQGREMTVRARWLVCAEGAAGTLRRHLGRAYNPRHPMGLALRQYCQAGGERLEWFDVHADLRDPWGLLPGYGWAFPVADGTVNVGVGLLHTDSRWRRVSLHAHLDRFVERLAERGIVDGEGSVRDRRGGRLFMGGSVCPPHGPGYVLVGDAAGMINPLTGEGIAYALETGRIAARHLHAALGRGERRVRGYGRDLQSFYEDYYRVGRGLVTMIGDPVRMERLVRWSTMSDRRLRFAMTLLLNLDESPVRSIDQLGARALMGLASLTGWDPQRPTANTTTVEETLA